MQILWNLGSIIIGLIAYVLMAAGVWSIAKRRGIRNAWLAWIPVANVWVLGCISDQYRYVTKGQNTSKRKLLLTLGIIVEVVSIVMLVAVFVWVFGLMSQVGLADLGLEDWLYMSVMDSSEMALFMEEHIALESVVVDEAQVIQTVLAGVLGLVGLLLLLLPLSIWYSIVYFMALYDLYASCQPKSAVVFLVLSILIGGILTGILVLVCKDKDDGMPPRQVVAPVMQELPVVEAPVDDVSKEDV